MKDNEKYLSNMKTVLDRIYKLCEQNDEMLEMFLQEMEFTLEDLRTSDAFGTEGQCDPRGDFREDDWTMWEIEE